MFVLVWTSFGFLDFKLWEDHLSFLGPPVAPFYPFFGAGFPY